MVNERKKNRKKKAIAAQDQVGNKVNAGIMDMICFGGGMCAESNDRAACPDCEEYKLGVEPGGPSNYAHAIDENETSMDDTKEGFPYKKYMLSLLNYMEDNGIRVKPFPKVILKHDEQDGLFIRTGYYEPETKSVTLFVDSRHPKDVMRSFAHEMIHHNQNLEGKDLSFSGEDEVENNKSLEKIESEAYLKGNVIFRKWTEHEQNKNKKLNESMDRNIDESEMKELIEPDDVDLSSFKLKRNLNPKFWDEGHLDSRIRLKLFDIADDFIETLGLSEEDVEDIIITGSIANYNWSKQFSDIDLHILVDYDELGGDEELLKDYFDSKKRLWNDAHKGIKIYGFPVEVYVQDAKEKHSSSGVYSLEKDKWIEEPSLDNFIGQKISKKYIREKVSYYTDKIDKLVVLLKKCGDDSHKLEKIYLKADSLWDKIKEERTKGFEKSTSEINNGNLIFKALRRLDYIGKLAEIKSITYDKLNSLS